MIIADTSGLLAFYNKREPAHDEVRAAIADARDPLVVSPFVIAELEYLLATRVGVDAAVTAIRELSGGAYELAQLNDAALADCAVLMERYADRQIGVTDASLVVLAQRYGTKRLLTLDRRHFSVVRPITGGRFVLLPGERSGHATD